LTIFAAAVLARGEFALRMINADVDEDGTYR
jgi:hypothetical protein